jgi:hypothetical protein
MAPPKVRLPTPGFVAGPPPLIRRPYLSRYLNPRELPALCAIGSIMYRILKLGGKCCRASAHPGHFHVYPQKMSNGARASRPRAHCHKVCTRPSLSAAQTTDFTALPLPT